MVFTIGVYHIKPKFGVLLIVGAVFGINELLGKPFTRHELVYFAMKGEVIASGSEHADNVAPCILGGFTLVRGYNPLDVVRIESPSEIFAVVLHPHIEEQTPEVVLEFPASLIYVSLLSKETINCIYT